MSQAMLGMLPFNIALLILSPENLKGLQQVKVLDIFDTNKNLHPEGLFSPEIFGKVGDERRNRMYGYIDLKVNIFHPTIFKAIVDLKELYGSIMAGTAYATFNEETKDFEPASMLEGETGFAFFLKHFPKLVFEERKSTSREFSIKLVNKNRNQCLMNKLIVMPAGLPGWQISLKPTEPKRPKPCSYIKMLSGCLISL